MLRQGRISRSLIDGENLLRPRESQIVKPKRVNSGGNLLTGGDVPGTCPMAAKRPTDLQGSMNSAVLD
jgi:hypothetical protein